MTSWQDNYEAIAVLGKGSFGNVIILAINKSTDQLCLIKEFSAKEIEQKCNSSKMADLTLHEPKKLSLLKHENIVRFFDVFKDDGGIIRIITEYCEGDSLQNYIKARNGEMIPELRIAKWAIQLAFALNYLHNQNLFHADISCTNIYLTNCKRQLKLGDFGAAKDFRNKLGSKGDINRSLYISPECWDGAPYDYKCESWAYGVVIYYLAAQNPPFPRSSDQNDAAYAETVKKGNPLPISGGYQDKLRRFIDCLLYKLPQDRLSMRKVLAHDFLLDVLAEVSSETSFLYEFPEGVGASMPTVAQDPGHEQPSAAAEPLNSADILKAVEADDQAVIGKLINRPNGIQRVLEAVDQKGETVAHKAARFGRWRILQMVLHRYNYKGGLAWVDVKNKDNDTAMHIAAARGYDDIITTLVSAGGNVDLLGGQGDNYERLPGQVGQYLSTSYKKANNIILRFFPLQVACLFGFSKVVKILIQFGANAMPVDSEGNLPIHLAAIAGHVDIVNLLIERGADIEVRGKDRRTVLLCAAAFNQTAVIKALLSGPRKAEVNAMDANDYTSLHIAAAHGWEETITMLVDGGADVNAKRGRNGITPLADAVRANQFRAVELLLQRGANEKLVKPCLRFISGQDNKGRAGWHYVLVEPSKLSSFFSDGKSVNLEEFGKVVSSGWGTRPPHDLEARLKHKYESE